MPFLFFLLETLLSRKTNVSMATWHSFVMLLSWKPELHFEYFRFMFKWQCFNRKKNCAARLLLPENIIGVHILNIFLQLSRSCLPAAIFYLLCDYCAWWYLIKTLTWVEGCWFKTSLRSTKVSCTSVLLEAVEASYFLWTS